MAVSLRDPAPAPPSPGTRRAPATPAAGRRRPIRDNPRLLLVGILLLVAALGGLLALASRSTSYSPDFLTEVVLYALSVADLTMLAALVFVLARNIVKLLVERRRALPFARFRAKLVAVLLGMTLIPSVLVRITSLPTMRTIVVGTSVITHSSATNFARNRANGRPRRRSTTSLTMFRASTKASATSIVRSIADSA